MKSINEFSGRHSFLSNFHSSPVYIMIGSKWVKCPTVEHGYQAQKTLHPDIRRRIAECATPAEAKHMGNEIKRVGYWDDVKTVIMLELLRQKFSRSQLRNRLKNTHDKYLIEGNHWHDNFWGHCVCDRCRYISGPLIAERPPGQNMLGRLLMRVRKDIR